MRTNHKKAKRSADEMEAANELTLFDRPGHEGCPKSPIDETSNVNERKRRKVDSGRLPDAPPEPSLHAVFSTNDDTHSSSVTEHASSPSDNPAIKQQSLDIFDQVLSHRAQELSSPRGNEVLRYLGTKVIGIKELKSITALKSHMRPEFDVIDALLYLEHTRWNLEIAKIEYNNDETDRAIAAGTCKSPCSTPGLPQYNRTIDRSPALPPTTGEVFDTSKLVIKVKLNSQTGKHAQSKSYTYPFKSSFDTTSPSPSSLATLNRWRREVFRKKVGTPLETTRGGKPRSKPDADTDSTKAASTTDSSRTGTNNAEWHALEERYVASNYALQNLRDEQQDSAPDSAPSPSPSPSDSTTTTTTMTTSDIAKATDRHLPNYAQIACDMEAVFTGRWLPGRVTKKWAERSARSVSGFLSRRYVNPQSKAVVKIKGRRDGSGWYPGRRHEEARREIVEMRTAEMQGVMGESGVVWPVEEMAAVTGLDEVRRGEEVEEGMVESEGTVQDNRLAEEAGHSDGTTVGNQVVDVVENQQGDAATWLNVSWKIYGDV